jgi:hypothetical protein
MCGVVLRVSEALGERVPECSDVQDWLFDAASRGSSIALESLAELGRHNAAETLRSHRTVYCGDQGRLYHNVGPRPEFTDNPSIVVNWRKDTVFHWIA